MNLQPKWGKRGMAVAPHSLAAESAVAVLREGGNALEAMIAAAATIAVPLTRRAGFGSVLGALVAGLIIGVVESTSAYLIGPVYKDVVVYVLFVLVLWFRPQGLMGKA